MAIYTVKTGTLADSTTDTHSRHLARKSNGDFWCAYCRSDGIRNQVYCAYSTDGGVNWTEEQVSAATGTNTQREIAIAIDSADNVHVVWDGLGYGTYPTKYNICYRKRITSWQTIEQVTDKNYNQRYPSIAIDSSDNIHIAWHGGGYGTGSQIYYDCIRYRKRTTSWQTEEAISDPAEYTRNDPAIAIDSANNVHVTWWGDGYGVNTDNHNLQYRKRTTYWLTREAITDIAASQFNSSIAIDSQDNVHVIWQGLGWGTNPNDYNIQYRKRTTSWQTQEAITDSSSSQQYGCSVAIDSNDYVHVIWRGKGWDTYSLKNNVEYRKRTDSWQTRVSITDRNYDQGRPTLIWALHPTFGGAKTNRPKTGYAIVWSGQIVSGYQVEFFNSDDLSWEAGSGVFSLSCTDELKVGDTTLEDMLVGLSVTEGISAGDSLLPSGMVSRLEGMKVGSSALVNSLIALTRSEGVKIGGTELLNALMSLSHSEGLKLGGLAELLSSISLLRSEGMKLSDIAAIMLSGLDRILLETGYVLLKEDGDALLLESAISYIYLVLVDNLKAGDELLNEMLADVQLSDGTKFTESSAVEMLANLISTEGIKLDEIIDGIVATLYSLSITNNLALGDERIAGMLSNLQLSDGTKVGDVPVAELIANLLRSEGLKLNDARVQALLFSLQVEEGLKLSDAALVDVIEAIMLAITDGIKVSDTPALGMIALLALVSAIKIGDARTTGLLGRLLTLWLTTEDYHNIEILTETYHNIEVFTEPYHCVIIYTGEEDMTVRRNWQRNETVPIWATVEVEGVPTNPDQGVKLTLISPISGTVVVDAGVMSPSGVAGRYVYYWNSAADSELGWYKAKGLAQDGTGETAKVTIEYGGFELQ